MKAAQIISTKTYPVLRSSRLFRGLNDAELDYALTFFCAAAMHYPQGTFLARQGERLSRFGIVISGVVQVYMDDINGDRMIMASVTPGETFGEALCFLETPEIPVFISAARDTEVLWLCADSVRKGASDAQSLELSNRFTAMLAERTLNMNNRIQVLSKSTLREKLTAFLSEYALKSGSETFSVPFDRLSMARYLGTDRSALSRELSRMKKEGVIDFYKNSFRLLNKQQ